MMAYNELFHVLMILVLSILPLILLLCALET